MVWVLSWLSTSLTSLLHRAGDSTAWRQAPLGHHQLWKSTLKYNGSIYCGLLTRFDKWCHEHHSCLDTITDLDQAAAEFVLTLRKGQGGHFVAAWLKAFPPARSGLHWTLAMHRDRCNAAPPEHHPPLSWPFDVGYGSILVLPRQVTRCDSAYGAAEAWPAAWRGVPAIGLPHFSAAGKDFARHCEGRRHTGHES